ncbi:conserved membrane protein of unknown function (plasmid) [Rhodovastum atsumiense]|uniref:Acyltransferase n=1 Tax=Rhodovastum atsumiense TaxID=504468 RepID=A0A5M6IJZ9_9PROT|nr:hypothetical protein [Rhodovastum atsumiense]KAA5608512.1 hypothetical protein F1189_28665 [Rhodovastum atsumiense]CAH2605789.1 conserved membrane protein of unknown function [Rhodovastum atsumiense]
MTQPRRLACLDALRGIALVQVVLSTYLAAFHPGILPQAPLANGTFTAIVLAIASDGYAGICLFLCVSGYALTWACGNGRVVVPRLLAGRTIRLVVPALGGLLLGWLTAATLADKAHAAGMWIGSDLLRALYPVPPSAHAMARDVLAATVTGYNGSSIVADMVTTWLHIPLPLEQSANPALWALPLHLLGSALIIYLLAARKIGLVPWLGLGILIGAGVLTTPLACLFVGHLLARVALTRPITLPATLAVPLIGAGGYFCLVPFLELPPAFLDLVAQVPYLSLTAALDVARMSKITGTAMIFVGVMLCPVLQGLLAAVPLPQLGRYALPVYLAHVPVITGLCPAVLIAAQLPAGSTRALLLAATALCGLAAVGAVLAWINRLTRRIARALARMSDRDAAQRGQERLVRRR